jgi:hypothetical protein
LLGTGEAFKALNASKPMNFDAKHAGRLAAALVFAES